MRSTKKYISVMLGLVLCAGVTACGNSETVITKEELNEYIEEVEITADNWRDYFTFEDFSYVEKDEFGEETGYAKEGKMINVCENVVPTEGLTMEFTYTRTLKERRYLDEDTGKYVKESLDHGWDTPAEECSVTIYPNELRGYGTEDFVPELLEYATTEQYNGVHYDEEKEEDIDVRVKDTYEISAFTLNRVKGNVKLINIPDDKWNTDEEGRYLIIKNNGSITNFVGFRIPHIATATHIE